MERQKREENFVICQEIPQRAGISVLTYRVKGDRKMTIANSYSYLAGIEKTHFPVFLRAITNDCDDSAREVFCLLEEYESEGFSLLPLNGKAPFEKDWPEKRGLTIDEAKNHLDSGGNIGMRTGNQGGGIFGIDVDHGWEQFAKDNAELLSRVRWIKTREGRGRVLVRGIGWGEVKKDQSWGELLGDRHQGALPPSKNPKSGMPYSWQGESSLPIVLKAVPKDFIFPIPLQMKNELAHEHKTTNPVHSLPLVGLSDAERATLKEIEAIIGYQHDHFEGKEAYFFCPKHPPDTTASFSYNVSNHKFSCFHNEDKLGGRGLVDLREKLFGKGSNENPTNILVCDALKLPPEPLRIILEDLWSENTMALLTGDGGIGKTHFVLQLLIMIAGGRQMNGTPFRSPTPREVVYITQEDEVAFLLAELLCQEPDLEKRPNISSRFRIISTAQEGENLSLTDKRASDYISKNLPEGCVFVLDSWSTFVTSNENDNTELQRKEIASLRRIMKERKASPLIIHHRPKRNPQTGHQASSRGGTVLPNACRFHIMLDGNHGSGVLLVFEKASRGNKPESISLVFDEERRLFVPKELDRYVTAFEIDEEFTTSQFAERIGKNPNDVKEKKQALDILRNRSKGEHSHFVKVDDGKRGSETLWKRKS